MSKVRGSVRRDVETTEGESAVTPKAEAARRTSNSQFASCARSRRRLASWAQRAPAELRLTRAMRTPGRKAQREPTRAWQPPFYNRAAWLLDDLDAQAGSLRSLATRHQAGGDAKRLLALSMQALRCACLDLLGPN